MMVFIALWGLCFSSLSYAETDDVALQKVLRQVLLHNEALRSAFHEWKASLEVPAQAGSLPDPMFNFTHFIEEVETRVGPQKRAFAIQQNFPWFGKLRLKSEMAKKMAEVQEQKYLNVINQLVYKTKQQYYKLYFVARALHVTRDHLQLLGTIEKNLQSKLKVAKSSFADLLKVQTELDRLTDRERSLKDRLVPILTQLGALMGKDTPAKIPLPQRIHVPQTDPDFETLKRKLNLRNLELKSLKRMLEKEEFGVRLAKKNLWPNFALGFKQVMTDDAINPGLAGSGKDPVMVSLGLSLPLWRGKIKSQIREKQQREKVMRHKKNNKLNWLTAELQMASFEFKDSEETMNLYREKLIPKAKQTLEVVRKLFESGKKGFFNIIDAERMLLHYELELEKALVNHASAAAKIKYLTDPRISVEEQMNHEK